MNYNDRDDFYVGYLPAAPAALARWLKPRIFLLVLVPVVLAALLSVAQGPFAASVFEFGHPRDFEGEIVENPYPMIRLERPGQGLEPAANSHYFLVSFGKAGARAAVKGLEGRRVRLRGQLIYRDDQTMIELDSHTPIQPLADQGPVRSPHRRELGEMTLVGEIVDSKCFLGVMNPGNLKTHKACAVRCISGGVPPVLLVRDSHTAHYFLLVSESGRQVNRSVLDLVGEPVEIRGRVSRFDDLYLLSADPETYRRLP